jgi:hypothetical protein
MESLLTPDREPTTCFCDTIKWHFLLYFDRYVDIVQKHKAVTGR